MKKKMKYFYYKLYYNKNWVSMIGKVGKNKNKQIGWKCENMEIIFSMSSQLWIYIKECEIVKYKIGEVLTDKQKLQKLTYAELFDKLSNLS